MSFTIQSLTLSCENSKAVSQAAAVREWQQQNENGELALAITELK